MAEYDNRVRSYGATSDVAIDAGLRAYMLRVYNYMLMGLGLTVAPLNLLQTELGLVIALTQIEMPLMLLPLLTIMNQMDQNLVDASRALGA